MRLPLTIMLPFSLLSSCRQNLDSEQTVSTCENTLNMSTDAVIYLISVLIPAQSGIGQNQKCKADPE